MTTVNLSLLAGAGWQFFDNSGVPLAGGLLYTYAAGTTTPQATYTTNAGNVANTNPIILNSAGRPPNEIWLTDSVSYKFVLQTSTSVLIGTWDNITGANDFSSFSNTSNISQGDALVGFRQANYTALLPNTIGRTVHSKFTEMISAWDFMTSAQIADVQSGAGTIDVRAACQNAIDAAKNLGASVHFPSGVYLINSTTGLDSKNNGLVIPYTNANSTANRVKLIGDGSSTVLKAGNNNMIVVRWSDSHCEMDGFSIDGNGKTTVWGLGLVPEDMTQTSTAVYQLYNAFRNLYILGCDEGIVLRTGPDQNGTDSGCWYNDISSTFIYYCKRGIWLMDCPVGSSGVNRNYFHQMRIGQGTNTGVQIDDGATNIFTEIHMEGINVGVSPNSTQIGIYIKQTGASSADNNSNKFIGCMQEGCTYSMRNDNAYSEFYGCEFSYPYSMVLIANPLVMLGSSSSQTPQFLPGYFYQSNSQINGYENNTSYLNAIHVGSNKVFNSTTVGTIAGSSSTTITLIAGSYEINLTQDIVLTGYETTSSGAISVKAQILAHWTLSALANYGIGNITYSESLGLNDFRAYTGMTLTVSASGNNVRLTIANGGANPITGVQIQNSISYY